MATADLSIFSGLLQPPKTVADYDMQAANLQGKQTANATAGLNNQIAQRGVDRANQLLTLSKSLPQGSTDLDRLAALRNSGFYDEADKLSTSLDNRTKTVAGANKDNADASATTATSQNATRSAYLQAIPTFANTDDVKQFLATGVQMGKLQQPDALQMISKVPDSNTNPQGFHDWKQSTLQALMSAKEQTALTTPDANNILTNQTSAANNATTNATSRQNNAATNATSISNNRANIGKDFKVAGLDASGDFDTSNGGTMDALVKGIANYQIPESVATARVPLAMRGNMMAQVIQANPNYSQADFNGVNRTVGSMANGPLGNQTRSNNVALTHLDTLGQLATAMGNTDYPAINHLKNLVATQTGGSAPNNFDAARQLVMGEIANVVAAGASTDADRKKAEAAVNSAESPKQLADAINTVIKPLMAGKLQGLEQQYTAGTSGRNDFRTKYLSPAAKASLDAVAPQAADSGNADLHAKADAILKGGQ